jgi:uncharacterized Tic20 family protein
MSDLNISQILMMLLPLLVIQLVLVVFALIKLVKGNVRFLPKWAWALIIVFFNLIGPVVFLIVGREKY